MDNFTGQPKYIKQFMNGPGHDKWSYTSMVENTVQHTGLPVTTITAVPYLRTAITRLEQRLIQLKHTTSNYNGEIQFSTNLSILISEAMRMVNVTV